MRFTALALVTILTGGPALAAGDALLIGNGDAAARRAFGDTRIERMAEALREQGLEVQDAADAGNADARDAFTRFVQGIEAGAAPVVVLLSGQFVHGGTGAWMLPADLDDSESAAAVMTGALPLDAVLAVLGQYPGRALLVLGEVGDLDEQRFAPYLHPGPGEFDIPQGVTVLRGAPEDVRRFALRALPEAGTGIAEAARESGLSVSGFAPDGLVLLRAADRAETARPAPPPPRRDTAAEAREAERREADETAWALAREADSATGYRRYLEGFPEGANAAAARQRLAAIEAEPFYAQRRGEEAMDLSREARRDIQRDLSLLGYSTRGIDGIFGQGTRSAIAAWQDDNDLQRSGYLDTRQIALLDRQSRDRAAALEEEARQRQAERESRDRALWQQAERDGSEASLRRYLEDFPDGLYAERARDLLEEIEGRRARNAAERDRAAWNAAREADTTAAYRDYLAERPRGAFAQEAQARIAELDRAAGDSRRAAEARREEERLGLNVVARRLAEARLLQLGVDPGAPDGTFDGQTRQAIRIYQRNQGLSPTGYLDQETVVRLLADGILGR